MVELLLNKAHADYKASFRREGVLHEVETLAARPLPPRAKDKEKDKVKEESKEDVIPPSGSAAPQMNLPTPATALTSGNRRTHTLDPEDAYTLRARVIRFKYLSNDVQAEGDMTLTRLRHLVAGLTDASATEQQLSETLEGVGNIFSSQHTTVSSFELLQSAIVDALLEFATTKNLSGKYLRYICYITLY